MLNNPHRRYNALTGEWVLVSPHRAKRPWLGQVEKLSPETLPTYDPTCYLCPRNERAGGVFNSDYSGTYVFNNDFAALLPDAPEDASASSHPLLVSAPEQGKCLVVCFSPRHDLTLPELELPVIENVLNTWTNESAKLAELDYIKYVQVFENKGAMMGCSNPHPHSQLWSQSQLPNEIIKELATQTEYFNKNSSPLLVDYIKEEHKQKDRILFSNDHFTALVPFWAVWPFEVLVSAHRASASLKELSSVEISALAEVFKQVTTRYDNLFEISFPYSMGFHQAPADGQPHPEWTLHAHFYPPLLRSATVRKFMVGYEMLAMPQRDITPEVATERLRSLSDIHYKQH
ncbi:UDP-glucose--hexose-1-phosphate uridylyltransferase [Candidatus Villigracilis affinis]|uniref:UDP-glucose--hexose-1-phosphate uridylyltransferase n=1 Tax=Candidatus Villigracilis affinis TaxID=3140682 RepID=UPI001DB66BCF|nr:UDP-glucose--hexose-1-phosphate uridylyltransferase [Anaerolineales bacterium]